MQAPNGECNVSLMIISRGVEILHQITLGINHLGIGLKNDDSAWHQPHQGGLATFLDHFGDQIFDHEGDDSAWYQPHQGGLATFWIILGIKFLIIKVVNLLGISTNRVD